MAHTGSNQENKNETYHANLLARFRRVKSVQSLYFYVQKDDKEKKEKLGNEK